MRDGWDAVICFEIYLGYIPARDLKVVEVDDDWCGYVVGCSMDGTQSYVSMSCTGIMNPSSGTYLSERRSLVFDVWMGRSHMLPYIPARDVKIVELGDGWGWCGDVVRCLLGIRNRVFGDERNSHALEHCFYLKYCEQQEIPAVHSSNEQQVHMNQ